MARSVRRWAGSFFRGNVEEVCEMRVPAKYLLGLDSGDVSLVTEQEMRREIEAAKDALREEVVEALRAGAGQAQCEDACLRAASHLSKPKPPEAELPTMEDWDLIITRWTPFESATTMHWKRLHNLAKAIYIGKAEVVLKEVKP